MKPSFTPTLFCWLMAIAWPSHVLATPHTTTDSLAPSTHLVDSTTVVRDLMILAADSMDGRLPGTAGSRKAQEYITKRFGASGIQPLDTTYRLPFTLSAFRKAGVNLVGYIPGTQYPTRYIVVSAHYDCLGKIGFKVFHGADDNASGVAALIAVASYLSGHPPLHSVLFCAFDAEEEGMKGSFAFTEHPPVPLDSIVIDLNLDMLGHNTFNQLNLCGTYHYPGLIPILNPLKAKTNLDLFYGYDSPAEGSLLDQTARSDHYPFHLKGIPFLKIGVPTHAEYHRSTDDFEHIDQAFYIAVCDFTIEAFLALDRGLTALH